MKISVIIPTYKPGYYFYDCLNSLLCQDICREYFEVVIVLNGERDPYFDSVESICSTNAINYRLIFTPLKGVSNARNLALNSISSDFVVFLDDDDILSFNFLSSLYERISFDSIVVSNVKTFVDDVNCLNDNYISKAFNKCSHYSEFSLFRYRGFLSSACGKMIPTLIINNTRFDSDLSLSEDALFMFAISGNIRNIRLTDNNTIYYTRLRQGSASRKKQSLVFIFQNVSLCLFKFSKVFFSGFGKINFLFYISRIVATIKMFVIRVFYS